MTDLKKVREVYHDTETETRFAICKRLVELMERIKELEAKLKDKDEAMGTCGGLIESARAMSKDAEDKLLNRIKELESENERLKEENLKHRKDNITMSLKYNEVLNDLNDENERLKSIVDDDEYKPCESSEVTHWMPLPPSVSEGIL